MTQVYFHRSTTRKVFLDHQGAVVNDLAEARDHATHLVQFLANAHSLGATPWRRADYIRKFETLTAGLLAPAETRRFLDLVQQAPTLRADQLSGLNLVLPEGALSVAGGHGIF